MANLQNLQINGTSFIDIVYPIGSIYETLDESFNPNTSFGGNWERIQGRFLLGAGTPDDNNHSNFGNNLTYNGTDKYDEPVGNMGGSSLHTLTLDEIPSHVGHLNSNDGYSYIGTGIGLYLAPDKMTTYSSSYGRGWNNTASEIYPAGTSRGGAEVTTICRLILPFVFGRELGKIIWQN